MKRDFINPKTFFVSPDQERRFLLLSKFFAILIIVAAVIVLTGWVGNFAFLTRITPPFPQMRSMTALSFLLLGLALLLTTSIRNKATFILRDIFSFIPVLFGFISIYEYNNTQLTMATQLIQEVFRDTTHAILPPTISILIISAGLAMLFSDRGKKNLFQYLILLGSIILLPSIIEHFYGIDFIYGFASHTKIALHVTIMFILLFIGILFSRPTVGYMSVLSSGTAGGYLARRMILTGMLLPLIIGGLVFAGFKLDFYDSDFRFLLYVATIIIFFTYVIWRNAKAIHRLDIVRRESEQSVYRLAAIVESSEDAIIGRDMKGVITDWNRGAEKLFGYKAEEMIGKSITPLFTGDQKNELQRYNTMLKKGAPIREYEAVRVRKDGSILPVAITASTIRNSSGRIVGVSSISRNISERKQIERQRELFISIASHELKTPVTSTKAYTQLLEKHFEKRNDKESLGLLKKMDAQLNKLTELIGYLLDVSTIQKGQLQLKMSKVDLDELIRETIDELSRTTTTHTITKIGSIKRRIVGDRSRLTQVLRNILTNAIKYSPEAKSVEVICETQPTFVRVSIKDYGIGIPKDEQKKVFDPLYRTEGVKKEKFSGLGLGLYITREIVRKHGGHLSLISNIGKGTTVTITLPTRRKITAKA